jgi:hypothetical protein
MPSQSYAAIWKREDRKKFPDKYKKFKKTYYEKNKEKVLSSVKAYQQENSSFIKERKNAKYKSSDFSCIKDKRLMQNYGIRLTDYQRMYIEQNGQCKICKSFHEVLDVDHCHNSKVVRGLLCQRSNKGLGLFKDNPIFLQSALDYLNHIVI